MSSLHPERVKEMVSQTQEWSRSHTEPKWFHALKARDTWKQSGMPNYDETFRLIRDQATHEAEPVRSSKAKGNSTKAEFVAAQKAKHEQKGWSFDQTKVEEQFDAVDVNHDGIASGKEKTAYWKRVTEEKSSN